MNRTATTNTMNRTATTNAMNRTATIKSAMNRTYYKKMLKGFKESLFFLLAMGMVFGAPVAPNETLISGEVIEYSILDSSLAEIKPEQTVYRLIIKIIDSKKLSPSPLILSPTGRGREEEGEEIGGGNFEQGENLTVYSKKELSPELFGKSIKGKISYSGDEKGGGYWLKEIQIIPEKK